MTAKQSGRRSNRVQSAHRLLLTVLGPGGNEVAKEIVTSIELSRHGARVRGYRKLPRDAQGVLTLLTSGRQANVRIAWQQKAESDPNMMDTGLELLSGFDFWGLTFRDPNAKAAAAGASQRSKTLQPIDLLDELQKAFAGSGSGRTDALETVWCGLIEQLEAHKIIRRDELIAAIRSIAQSRAVPQKTA
jgi:hypothetical protein